MTLVAMILVAMNLVAMNLVAMNLCHRRFWKMFCCTPLALASGGLLSGCHQSKPAPPPDPSSMIHDVPIFPGPKLAPLDASALSGGKVTHYFRGGSNPNDPAQEAMLQACRQLPIQDATARSVFVIIKTGQFGNFPLNALQVGNQIFVLPTDLVTMGLESGGANDNEFVLYPLSPQKIILTAGSKQARVGNRFITLQSPVVRVVKDRQFVMTLPDMIRIFQYRDAQSGSKTIQNYQITESLKDYHR